MNRRLEGEAYLRSRSKRNIDLAMALGSLPISVPLSLVSASSIVAVDRIKPIFTQGRIGNGGDSITVPKLTTMGGYVGDNRSKGMFDNRATKVGRMLRIIGLDELPQLASVIYGNMSIVGPRPQIADDFEHMRETLSPSEYEEWYRAYTLGKPGLISEFSVLTHRAEPLIENTYFNRAEYDVRYASLASIGLDKEIICGALRLAPSLMVEAVKSL